MQTRNWVIQRTVRDLAKLERQRETLQNHPHCGTLKEIIHHQIIRNLEHAVSHGFHQSPHWVCEGQGGYLISNYLAHLCRKYKVEYDYKSKKEPQGNCC